MSPLRRRYRSLPVGSSTKAGPDPRASGERSEEACPACGRHALSVLDFPYVATMGVQPYADILGMGEPPAGGEPGIGCLDCGTQWPNLDAFRAAQDS